MEEKRAPRELLISAIKNLNKAQEDFELGTFQWPDREAALAKFYRLRESMVDALAPLFVPPIDPNEEELHNIASSRWDTLKQAFDIGGPTSAITSKAARAFADAAELSSVDWQKRKAADMPAA